MQFVPLDQIADGLRSLFSPDMPVGVRCRAILNGDAAGRILADDPIQPTYAIVQEPADGTIFVGGSLAAPILAKAIDTLRQDHDVVVGLWHDDPRLQLFPSDAEYKGAAIDFTNRLVDNSLDQFLQIPPGCHLRPVDRGLFPRLAGYEWYVAMFGSVEAALTQGQGYCLMRDDNLLCEATAGPYADDTIEIGVHTHEPYRGQGYATITCARLIRDCEAQGYRTYWNTAKQNAASVTLARRLGYQAEREFRVMAWFRPGY